MDKNAAKMTIYQTMVAIDGVKSYMYVRADNHVPGVRLRPYASKR
jgi:hypothetical protein